MSRLHLRHAFASAVFLGVAAFLAQAGCDGVGSVAGASCSNCQDSFTTEQCKKWGDLAGCSESSTSETVSCGGVKGCSFTSCSGSPICDDKGEDQCATSESLTQADCDEIAKSASCTSATTGEFQADGKMVTGCHFEGCHFHPDCPS